MRTVRMSMALAILAALLVQSVVAIAAPTEKRAGQGQPAWVPQYQPSEASGRVPGGPGNARTDKDPRHC